MKKKKPTEEQIDRRAKAKFIKTYSGITLYQLCEEMDISRDTIYKPAHIAKEKAYWIANRIEEKVFIMFVEYYSDKGDLRKIPKLHRVKLDWRDKDTNLRLIRNTAKISAEGIAKEHGFKGSNAANGKTTYENICKLFDIMSRKLERIWFTDKEEE